MTLDKEAIAEKLMDLQEERDNLEEENDQLREKIAEYQRRDQAERILIGAKEASSDDLPSKVQPANLKDFLAKRARLEEKDQEEREKVASLVEYADDEGSVDGLVEDIPAEGGGNIDPLQFNEWIKQQDI